MVDVARTDVYEPESRRPFSCEYLDQLTAILPAGWTVHRRETWIQATGPSSVVARADYAIQGFKIHVSSTPRDACRVLDIVVPACVSHGVDFKVAGDPAMLYTLNSKRHPRGASGKFMTLYPPSEATFKRVLNDLYDLTADADLAGPRILSDRQYRDSLILSYRYGGFISPRRVNPDGTRTHCLVAPTGEHVPDERRPFYSLPEWVSDPFDANPVAVPATRFLLADRYVIDEARGFSNSGGLYYGTDTVTGERIVVKEARPFTNCFQVGDRSWDAVFLLAREYDILKRLTTLPFVPRPIELVTASGHTFLVEERIEAITLRQLWASNEVILSPYIRRPGRVESWMRIFRHVARSLIEMITALHDHGVLAGDLSPDNVLIDPGSHAMWLIDFESSVTSEDAAEILRYASVWGTPGFLHPLRSARDRPLPDDDYYAAGMVLFSGLAPVNPLFTLKPTAAALFLDKFTSLGLPSTVRDVLTGLWSGDVARAVAALAPPGPSR